MAVLRAVQMFSYFYFFVGGILLLLPFTDQKNKWSVSDELFGSNAIIDIYGGLFVFCTELISL